MVDAQGRDFGPPEPFAGFDPEPPGNHLARCVDQHRHQRLERRQGLCEGFDLTWRMPSGGAAADVKLVDAVRTAQKLTRLGWPAGWWSNLHWSLRVVRRVA